MAADDSMLAQGTEERRSRYEVSPREREDEDRRFEQEFGDELVELTDAWIQQILDGRTDEE